MCISMGKRLAVFYYFKVFWVKMQNSTFFEEKMVFESSFYKIDV